MPATADPFSFDESTPSEKDVIVVSPSPLKSARTAIPRNNGKYALDRTLTRTEEIVGKDTMKDTIVTPWIQPPRRHAQGEGRLTDDELSVMVLHSLTEEDNGSGSSPSFLTLMISRQISHM